MSRGYFLRSLLKFSSADYLSSLRKIFSFTTSKIISRYRAFLF
ncbi:hypothetical protein CSUNSWCD_2290 [Campylobacter showae CSUNSWCD]|uniref:Uncharacterized protein n=1 Tax=Campylobacter showae CSUNSWCD TaxID=1244083 RepID=M5IFJ3_9BACT|nr:hypothetical protein CSUNSWCD_2290 [Campylobacter showae CSUNSWCD]